MKNSVCIFLFPYNKSVGTQLLLSLFTPMLQLGKWVKYPTGRQLFTRSYDFGGWGLKEKWRWDLGRLRSPSRQDRFWAFFARLRPATRGNHPTMRRSGFRGILDGSTGN
jgi:hypothetical protein